MRSINEENIKRERNIEVGKIIFTDICNLDAVGITKQDVDFDNEIDVITTFGNQTPEYLKKYTDETTRVLIAIKYLGDDIFEEMTTGEKIVCDLRNVIVEYDDGTFITHKLSDSDNFSITLNTELNYDDYLKTHSNSSKKLLSKFEYIQKLETIKKRNIQYPLRIGYMQYNHYFLSDKTKELYLKKSDSERRMIITEAKMLASLDSIDVNEKITKAIEKLNEFSKEDIEMANLDNQLYDFERKSITLTYNR